MNKHDTDILAALIDDKLQQIELSRQTGPTGSARAATEIERMMISALESLKLRLKEQCR